MISYLDNSFLNRPFDDPEIGTNKLESEVLSIIIQLVSNGKLNIVNSAVIEYENSLNPIPERRMFVEGVLKQSKVYQNVNEHIKKRSDNLVIEMKLSPIDALHIAAAEAAKVDLFITCDYNVVKKYKGKLKVINPFEFLNYYEYASK